MSKQQWEEHNESFQYEPPEGPPELWSDDEYAELADRVITQVRMGFSCDQCSTGPFRNLRKALDHVEQNHMERLIEQAVARQ